MPKGNMAGYQTRNSPSTVKQFAGSLERGERMDPPKGAKQPGRKLANSQTRNSPSNRA